MGEVWGKLREFGGGKGEGEEKEWVIMSVDNFGVRVGEEGLNGG